TGSRRDGARRLSRLRAERARRRLCGGRHQAAADGAVSAQSARFRAADRDGRTGEAGAAFPAASQATPQPVIELRRRPGEFARVGHRGAAALAPENTLRSFELAVELGCDMLEFDVLALRDRTLVLAHSNDLREVSHGAARGRVGRRTLDGLRRFAPNLTSLDEALAFFVER